MIRLIRFTEVAAPPELRRRSNPSPVGRDPAQRTVRGEDRLHLPRELTPIIVVVVVVVVSEVVVVSPGGSVVDGVPGGGTSEATQRHATQADRGSQPRFKSHSSPSPGSITPSPHAD